MIFGVLVTTFILCIVSTNVRSTRRFLISTRCTTLVIVCKSSTALKSAHSLYIVFGTIFCYLAAIGLISSTSN